MAGAPPSRSSLLSTLHHQSIRIPPLAPLFPNWPNPINPHQSAVTSVVSHVLSTHNLTPAVEIKLQRANLTLLVASWFPFASAQTLKDIAYFVCWMYMVDDAIIDKVSWPGLDNAAAFDAAYEELLEFVRGSLQLDGHGEEHTAEEGGEKPTSSGNPAIASFQGIGIVMVERYSVAQRQRFYDACKVTMDGYRTEQRLRIAERMPSWEEYWGYREGSSCIRMCIAMVELEIGSELPEEAMASDELQGVWKETVIVCWLTNDVVSAKKELGEGFIENAVALLGAETGRGQDGMDRTMGVIREAVGRFEDYARRTEGRFCVVREKAGNGHVKGSGRGDLGLTEEEGKGKDNHPSVSEQVKSRESPRYGLQILPKDSEGGITFFVGQ